MILNSAIYLGPEKEFERHTTEANLPMSSLPLCTKKTKTFQSVQCYTQRKEKHVPRWQHILKVRPECEILTGIKLETDKFICPIQLLDYDEENISIFILHQLRLLKASQQTVHRMGFSIPSYSITKLDCF